jgi:trehalose/maltose transport system substrate-binding protein
VQITKNDNKINFIRHFVLALIFFLSAFISFSCSSSENQFTIWIGGSPEEVDFWASVVNDFNSEYNSHLQLIRQPTYTDQRRQALVVSLQAEQKNPDLFLMDVVWINQFIKSNWLEPLNKNDENKFSTDEFFKKTIESVDSYHGTLYALPAFMDVALLYYRKDLLKKYNYSDPPQTWMQLLNMCIKIQSEERKTNKSFNGFVWEGAQYEGLICSFMEFISSMGGRIMQGDSININTSANIRALQFMQNLIQKYQVSPENTYTEIKEEEVRRAFQNGNALFERNWTYAWQLHQSDDSFVKGKTGITLLPHSRGDSSYSTLGGWHIGISKFSDEKNKAREFIKFVTSFKVQKEMLMKIGWSPGRKDIYEDKDIIEKMPRIKIIKEALEHTIARPTLPYYPQVSEVIQRYVNNCLAGKSTPEYALQTIQNELEKLEKLYGKYD